MKKFKLSVLILFVIVSLVLPLYGAVGNKAVQKYVGMMMEAGATPATFSPFLELTCYPDTTFKAEIDTLIMNGTAVEGKLVKFTWLGNYQVTSPDDGDIADGVITNCVATTDTVYRYVLTLDVFHYMTSSDSTHHTPVNVQTFDYGGIIGLHDQVVVNGSDYDEVTDSNSSGFGAVISKDTDAGTVDVIF